MLKITKDSLSGGADTSDVIMALAHSTAKIAAGSIADLTDNSGGAAADGDLPDVPLCNTAPAVGNNVPTKAAAETALGQVKDALTELAGKIIAIHARVPAFNAAPVNNIGGTAPDGTIAAVTVAPAADNVGPRVARAGFNASLTVCRDRLRELQADTNVLAVACGLSPTTGDAGGVSLASTYDHVYDVISTDTGAAPADSSGSTTVAESTASLTALRDGIKEVATKLNAITSDAGPAATVIAG
jgi:hypothetical protein